MNRILVTGARGFVGRHTLSILHDRGFEVHAVTSSIGAQAHQTNDRTNWHVADLLDNQATDALVSAIKPSHVLHSAWVTEHGKFWSSPENLRWVAMTANLVKVFSENGGKRFVNVGTCAEYSWDQGICKEGETSEIPHTFYGASKLATHKVLLAAARQFGFQAATGRIFFCYGPNEDPKRLISHACIKLAMKQTAQFSSGVHQRDFMHVTDVANGLANLVDSQIEGACNISSGTPVTIHNVIEMLGEISGGHQYIEMGALPDRSDDPLLLAGNNDLLRTTGWKPNVNLEEGLQENFEWWRRHVVEAN